MDYNDNDYEGHNYHIAGEESSKIYSVLRPFSLPKFDFDDSLQGHLRFDSLVENEVFLGISSQEDNQWIEDFSRGGSGIEFSSSAPESCALPRHINVWSEVTSSESVEMLLKAVGQEEMMPGERLVEESEPGDQLCNPAGQMKNVRQDNKIDIVNDLNSSITPAKVEVNITGSNPSVGVQGVQTEVSVHARGTNVSSHGQEEMVPGERLMEESEPGDQLSKLTGQMKNMGQDNKIDVVNDLSSSITPAEVEVNGTNPSVSVEGIQTEVSVHARGTNVSSHGQEEMVPGERLMEESKPGDQLSNLTGQMKNMGQDNKIDIVNDLSSSMTPAEVEVNISGSNPSVCVEGVQTGDGNDEIIFPNSENLKVNLKTSSDYQEETCGLGSRSLLTQVQQETILVLHTGTRIDQNGSPPQNVSASMMGSIDQDNTSDVGFISSYEEGCNRNEGNLGAETGITQCHSLHEIPSQIGSSKHSVQYCVSNFTDVPTVAQNGEFMSSESRCNDVGYVGAGDSQHRTAVLASSTEIKQSEGGCVVHEESSMSQGDAAEQVEVQGSNTMTSAVSGDTKSNQVPVTQTPYYRPTGVGSEDAQLGTHISVETSHVSSDSIGNPSDKIVESNHEGGKGHPVDHTFEGDLCGEKSVNDDMSGAGDTTAVQENFVVWVDHATPPLLTESTKISTECTIPIQLDGVREDVLVVSVDERDIKKLPFDSGDVACDGNEKDASTLSSEEGIKIGTTTGSQPNSSAGDCLVLNSETEDTNLTTSYVEGELVDRDNDKSPSCDLRDQSKETEPEALEQPITSVSMESLESDELTLAFETEKGKLPDSETVEAHKSGQSHLLVEPSGISMPDEGRKVPNELAPVFETNKGALVDVAPREIMKNSDQILLLVDPSYIIPGEGHKELPVKRDNFSSALTVQDVGVALAPTEMAMGEGRRNSGDCPLTVSDTSCAMEMDKFNQVAPDIRCTDLARSVINNQASLKRDDVENIGKIVTKAEISVVNDSAEVVGTITFDGRPLGGQSKGDSGNYSQSFPESQACKLSLTGGGSPSTSGSSLTDPIAVKEVSHVSSLTPLSVAVEGPSERKARRASSKSGKTSANKGNQVKETTPLRQPEKWEKSSHFLSPIGAGHLVTYESIVKTKGPVPISTTSLPDLNNSASSSTLFQQPFTDLQQVQLRAQIFIYGSLIQGAAPDEACMMSAFDGGRSIWEPFWHACVERVYGQKPNVKNTETPVPLRSGGKTLDRINRQSFIQSDAFTPMSGRASKKSIPSPAVNQAISLLSPLWNISTPFAEALTPGSTSRSAVTDYQAVAPLNPYQTPPVRNYVSHTTGSSQAPFRVPWLASSQKSPYDIIPTYPAFPGMTEPVKLVPNKESIPVVYSSPNYAPAVPTSHNVASTNAEASSVDLKKLNASTGQSGDKKARKRKKSSITEDAVRISVAASVADTVSTPAVANQFSNKGAANEALSQFPFMAGNQGDQIPTPFINSHFSTSVAVATPSKFVQTGSPNRFLSMGSLSITSDQTKGGDMSIDKTIKHNEDFSKVEEAKLQAQEAASLAAATISQCQGVWSQLDEQKQAGLTLDAQCKLASAAVAIAAAASVAKAAAAAAKIASTAALQAKQMADEAVTKSVAVNSTGHDGEAAKKKIEASSAASRYAENLDAIVKAAELAAEAVSHTEKIVSMGDPFSLSELAEAGPSNYWKRLQVGMVPGLNSCNKKADKSSTSNVVKVPDGYVSQHEESDKHMDASSNIEQPIKELCGIVMGGHITAEENIIVSGKHEDTYKLQNDEKSSNSANTFGISHPDIESRSTSQVISSIKEGSFVEVLKDYGDSKAWFSASVLSLKESEALVFYAKPQSIEGSVQLQEWVSIEAKYGEAPKVRIPHVMTALQIEGTRKRRRAAVKDYNWSVGDKVDAWVQNCWREGVISEKSKDEATALTVHFPEQGESLSVKNWDLRPTLIWNDGQWMECHRPGSDPASQGDSPAEKRPKLGGSSTEAKGNTNMAESTIHFAETRRNEVRKLPLSTNEKLFNIGTTNSKENKPNVVMTKRAGVEKQQGSRVVFGVPKPGKKRKFMDVSKHYTSDRVAKTNVPDDSVKLSQLLAPLGSRPRGFKHNSKPDLKEKQALELRPRSIKPGRPPVVPSRTIPRKDDSTLSRPNARSVGGSDTKKGSLSSDDNESGEQNSGELGSTSKVGGTSGDSMVFSSQARTHDKLNRTARRNPKSEQLSRGRPAPASERSANNEINMNSVTEVSEPRRSNRRIQPTSRLLEGLQSSLLVSKVHSSHEKSHKSRDKVATKGTNNRG